MVSSARRMAAAASAGPGAAAGARGLVRCLGAEQRAVIEELTFLSEKVVIMSERAVGFLVAQGVPP